MVTMLYSNIIPLMWLWIVSSLSASRYPNSTLEERIAIYLHELCPGTGVCMNDVIKPSGNKHSCCGVCSCLDDCDIRGNCCFPKKENVSDENTLSTTNRYSECIVPITKNDNRRVLVEFKMITATRQYSDNIEIINATVTCGDTKVAPWGSLYPVYSKTTGKIYKNRICADAYSVHDGEVWEPYVSCSGSVGFDLGIDDGTFMDNCLVGFVYKGDFTSIISEVCYDSYDYVSTCGRGYEFAMPDFTSATRDDIVAACESSGLLSPYGEYRNIFCTICNMGTPMLVHNCEFDSTERGVGGLSSFTVIIDASFSEQPVQRPENTNIACIDRSHQHSMNTGHPPCRPIFCPFSKKMNKHQKCIYPDHDVMINGLTVYLHLYSSEPFNSLPLYRDKSNLKSPWPYSWSISSILFDTSDKDYFRSTRIMVTQTLILTSPIKPKVFFKRFQNYLNKQWFLVSSNKTTTLQSKLSSFKSMYSDVFHSPRRLERILVKQAAKSHIYITPVFFCELVTLSSSEFELPHGVDSSSVFNNISNSSVYDGSFILINNNKGNVTQIKICLEKSGFIRTSQNSSTSLRVLSNDSILVCFISILVFRHFI